MNNNTEQRLKLYFSDKEIDKILPLLKKYHNKKIIRNIDFFKYSKEQLINIVKNVKETVSQKEQRIKEQQTEFIFENDQVKIIRPLTYEASCLYGRGTKWCITRFDTDFKETVKKGGMYIIIPKNDDTEKILYVYNGRENYTWNSKNIEVFSAFIKLFNIPKDIFENKPILPLDENGTYIGDIIVKDYMIEDGKLPANIRKIKKIEGSFDCIECKSLITLESNLEEVTEYFSCQKCNLTTCQLI